ncbi:minor tail protein [Gordonia phage Sour]|uniref:DUF7172 domain-containing protein n=1 Tax=Gordonia phage Sour TaxID=2182349 RepID=A0A2U8ULC4_9CAUD|nr:minor tail protein [Gordonia phage Sour]AWN04236.1 hypothetical protein PBI_SOUR_35 [Gordonia phage Sour]
MSLKLCVSEYMLSDTNGVGMRRGWFPRIVAEAFLESTKDGEIKRAPDPVPMITGDLAWFNNSPDPQVVAVQVHRAPRSVTTTNPNTVLIQDAWTFDIGISPSADTPTVMQDSTGGRLQLDRAYTAGADLKFGRVFLDTDDAATLVPVGIVPSMQSLHFRYLASVQTPGTWTTQGDGGAAGAASGGSAGRHEAQARWTRLTALAAPIGAS